MNYAYLAGTKDGSEAVLIDPSWDENLLVETAKKEGRKIAAVLATHGHFDHVNALNKIAKTLKIPVYVHELEPNDFSKDLDIRKTGDGSIIEEAGLKIKCLHTPGHTQGSQCFLIGDSLFTGDTLFVDGCGRVDLEGGDPMEMSRSLARLAKLPRETVVYPGHNYGSAETTTIGEQKDTNPYLREDPSILL